MRFKEFLNEEKTNRFLTNPDKIRKILYRTKMTPKIHPDGTVDLLSSDAGKFGLYGTNIDIGEEHLTEENNGNRLIIKFGVVDGNFQAGYQNLGSMEGFPSKAKIVSARNNQITTLDFCPRDVQSLDLENNPITSLVGISKKIDSISSRIILPESIREGGLGLLSIKGKFEIRCITIDDDGEKLNHAIWIIRKHKLENQDLIDCKRELIAAGLKEFAKL